MGKKRELITFCFKYYKKALRACWGSFASLSNDHPFYCRSLLLNINPISSNKSSGGHGTDSLLAPLKLLNKSSPDFSSVMVMMGDADE